MATPLTDAKERETEKCDAKMHAHYGWKFARRLETERDALAKDAARYRHLRQHDGFIHNFKVEHWEAPTWQCLEWQELDAAIDAALDKS